MKRLPRRTNLLGYMVETILVSQTVLREEMGDEDGGIYEGGWFPDLGEKISGRILILATLPLWKKRVVWWHELEHAVTDISSWDEETRPIQ
jgi:hypothetical protein